MSGFKDYGRLKLENPEGDTWLPFGLSHRLTDRPMKSPAGDAPIVLKCVAVPGYEIAVPGYNIAVSGYEIAAPGSTLRALGSLHVLSAYLPKFTFCRASRMARCLAKSGLAFDLEINRFESFEEGLRAVNSIFSFDSSSSTTT